MLHCMVDLDPGQAIAEFAEKLYITVRIYVFAWHFVR